VHAEAFDWVRRHATDQKVTVLDIGGRNINGTCRELFPSADYTALDIRPGEGVDIVADATKWTPDKAYGVVVCTEVFEHTSVWRDICRTAFRALRPGGRFIVTMAGPGRPDHSAVDGQWRLLDGEHYANIEPDELQEALSDIGFTDITVDYQTAPCDTRAVATKPMGGKGGSRR
jgi:SAM-dependent methyltransferase